jgi:small subunit ribosomal protein S1
MPEDMDNTGTESGAVVPEAVVAAPSEVTESAVETVTEVPAEAPSPLEAVPSALADEIPGEVPPMPMAAEPLAEATVSAAAAVDPVVADSLASEASAAEPVVEATVAADAAVDPVTESLAPAATASDAASATEVPAVEIAASEAPTDGAPVTERAVTEVPAAEPAPVVPVVFTYQTGDIVPGVITAIGANGIEVDLDGELAVIPKAELVDGTDPGVGESVEGMVIRHQAGSGRYVISPKRAAKSRAWLKILAAFESGETMEGVVTETTKGGLIVNLGLRAFLPESLIDVRKPADTKSFIGQTVTVKIIECEKLSGERAAAERRSEKLVVNRKITMEADRKAAKQALMSSLNVGDRKTGKVTALTDFGAFVDIGGVEGLIHISELAHRQVASAGEVVKVGEPVDVIIVEVKTERGKIGLSRKRALPNPWTQFAENHKVGDLVFGQVTGLAPFGAFVLVEGEGHDPVEGLVHISELSRFRVEEASEVVAVGEGVWTQVLAIEPEKKRVSLSLRRALE